MKDVELQARLQYETGLSPATARDLTRQLRDKIHPESAMATRVLARAAGTPGIGALGNTKDAVQYGGLASKAGSFAGPVGTAIGFAIGAAAGLLIKRGNKTGRQDHANVVLNAMSQLPPDYAGRQFSDENFHDMMWTLFLTQHALPWGGTALRNHPSTMDNWAPLMRGNPKAIMTAGLASTAVSAPPANRPATVAPAVRSMMARFRAGGGPLKGLGDLPGATVTVPVKGYNGESRGTFTFVNPGIQADAGAWADIFARMYAQVANQYNPPSSSAALQSSQDPYLRQYFMLLADWLRAQLAPQSLSETLANAPVASVPPSVVQNGRTIAQTYMVNGVPQLPAPSIQAPSPPLQNANGVYLQPVPIATPTGAALNPQQDTTAGIMYDLLRRQGYPVDSPQGQQILADVAATGIEHTAAGPPASSLPSWALPVAGFALIALLIRRK